MNSVEQNPGEYTGPDFESQSSEGLFEKFDALVCAAQAVGLHLTANRLANTVDVLDLNPLDYHFQGNTTTDPTESLYSFSYDIFKQMGYDIAFATPALYKDSLSPIGNTMVKLMVAQEHRTAINALSDNISWFKQIEGNPDEQVCMLLRNAVEGMWMFGTTFDRLDTEVVARARMASAISAESRNRSRESPMRWLSEGYFKDFADTANEQPDAAPLGLEECAGMIASLTHRFLEENPQHKLENLS